MQRFEEYPGGTAGHIWAGPIKGEEEGFEISISASNIPAEKKSQIRRYLEMELKKQEIWGGKFHLYKYRVLGNGMQCFSIDGVCPLHHTHHDTYGGFQYKVSPTKYGGWKCWKTDEWICSFEYADLCIVFAF